jgi:hypothetical protein
MRLLVLLLLSIWTITIAQINTGPDMDNYNVGFAGQTPELVIGKFEAQGFRSVPDSGQINSNSFIVNGLSTSPEMTFGSDYLGQPFANGQYDNGSNQGGIYYTDFEQQSMLVLLPTNTELSSGSLVFRFQNTSATDTIGAFSFYLKYAVQNLSENTSNYVFSYSKDNQIYRYYNLGNFNTPASAQNPSEFSHDSLYIGLGGINMAPGEDLYLRWEFSHNMIETGWFDRLGLVGFSIFTDNIPIFREDEPAEAAADLRAEYVDEQRITIKWNSATVEPLPSRYLVFAATDSSSIPQVQDGNVYDEDLDWDDGLVSLLLYPLSNSASFSNLLEGQDYYFRVFPYLYSGNLSNYKLDDVRTLKVTTNTIPFLRISQIQDTTGLTSDSSAYVNTKIRTKGLVIGEAFPGYTYLTDGIGPWTGIYLNSGTLEVGDSVLVTGIVYESDDGETYIDVTLLDVFSSANQIPEPYFVSGLDIFADQLSFEPFESCYIELQGQSIDVKSFFVYDEIEFRSADYSAFFSRVPNNAGVMVGQMTELKGFSSVQRKEQIDYYFVNPPTLDDVEFIDVAEPEIGASNIEVADTTLFSLSLEIAIPLHDSMSVWPNLLVLGKQAGAAYPEIIDGVDVNDNLTWGNGYFAYNVFPADTITYVNVDGIMPNQFIEFKCIPYMNPATVKDYNTSVAYEKTISTRNIPQLTVPQLRDTSSIGGPNYENTVVELVGQVSFIYPSLFVIIRDGLGPWSGLLIDDENLSLSLNYGDSLRLIGKFTGDRISEVYYSKVFASESLNNDKTPVDIGEIFVPGAEASEAAAYNYCMVTLTGFADNDFSYYGESYGYCFRDSTGFIRLSEILHPGVDLLGGTFELTGVLIDDIFYALGQGFFQPISVPEPAAGAVNFELLDIGSENFVIQWQNPPNAENIRGYLVICVASETPFPILNDYERFGGFFNDWDLAYSDYAHYYVEKWDSNYVLSAPDGLQPATSYKMQIISYSNNYFYIDYNLNDVASLEMQTLPEYEIVAFLPSHWQEDDYYILAKDESVGTWEVGGFNNGEFRIGHYSNEGSTEAWFISPIMLDQSYAKMLLELDYQMFSGSDSTYVDLLISSDYDYPNRQNPESANWFRISRLSKGHPENNDLSLLWDISSIVDSSFVIALKYASDQSKTGFDLTQYRLFAKNTAKIEYFGIDTPPGWDLDELTQISLHLEASSPELLRAQLYLTTNGVTKIIDLNPSLSPGNMPNVGFHYNVQAQNFGDHYRYKMYVSNHADESFWTEEKGFFAGNMNADWFDKLHEVDSNGVSPYLGHQVSVYGVLSTEQNFFGPGGVNGAILVAPGKGIRLYRESQAVDRIEYIPYWESIGSGQLAQKNGEIMIVFDDEDSLGKLYPGSIGNGVDISIDSLLYTPNLAEKLEGSFIVTDALTIIDTLSGHWGKGDASFLAESVHSGAQIEIHISSLSHIWRSYGEATFDVFQVRGVLGQNDSEFPYTSNYTISPFNIYNVTGIGETVNGPQSFNLGQNYPNPFNPMTSIPFTLPYAQEITLTVYNNLGQVVFSTKRLFDAGRHRLKIDATSFASGVYFYRLQTDSDSAIRKMILLK